MRRLAQLTPFILLMTGCMQETTLEERQHTIQYNVVTENTTRALHSYSSNNYPSSFLIWAVNDEGKSYFGPDQMKQSGNIWLDKTNTRYWPKEHGLSFYALVDYTPSEQTPFKYEMESIGEGGRPYISKFQVAAGAADQVDLMYAMAENQTYSASPVLLKFHHALSQVVFKAQNNTHDLKIQISNVIVGQLAYAGNFTFPAATASATQSSWTLDPDETKVQEYTTTVVKPDEGSDYVTLTPLPTEEATINEDTKNTVVNLTGSDPDNNIGYGQVLTLLPQTQQAWDPTQKGEVYNGAYFKLTAIITHISGDTELYNGNIVIPADINWDPGKRYTYTFIFNPGTNGGYTDTPNDPQPVLAPITFKIEVDDFIDVDKNQDMNTGDTPTPDDPQPGAQGVTVTSPTAEGNKYN